jgi:AcrR family transcriptional regulator
MGRAPGIRDEAKRQAVIEAAIALVAAHGPAVSLSDVARRSGVSRQTIYNHFGDKAALLGSLLGEIDRRRCPVCPPASDEAPRHALGAYAVALLQWLHAPDMATALRARGRGLGGPGARAPAVPPWCLETLAAYLREETRRGRLDVARPRKAAELFFDLVLAGPQLRIAFGDATRDLDLHDHARRCARLFVGGYAASRAAPGAPPERTAPVASPSP